MNLKSLLEQQFFPFVIKPARYLGNELGSSHKSNLTGLKVVLAVPDKYDRGMCQPALHRIYHSINSLDFATCERVFAPDLDAENLLRIRNIRLFSLETFRPVDSFDLLLIIIPSELCLTTLLTILDLSGIPLWQKERGESRILVGAIGAPCFNPEPIADYLDFYLVTDLDQSLSDALTVVRSRGGASREETLTLLSNVSGIYVPALCEPEHDSSRFLGVAGREIVGPESAKTANGSDVPVHDGRTAIVPFEETVRDQLSIGVVSGMGHDCPSCRMVEGGRRRTIDVEEVVARIVRALDETGYDEIGLAGFSQLVSRCQERLITLLSERVPSKEIRVSLPPFEPNLRVFEAIRRAFPVHKPSLTFTIGAGSERLREMLGIQLDVDEVYQVVANAYASGWMSTRLLLQIGLPAEQDEDLRELADIVRNCAAIADEYSEKAVVNAAISIFLPKPHTPWQWESQISPDEYVRKTELLRREVKARNIQIKVRPAAPSILEGVLSRGDRRLSDVVFRAYELGARFDNWSEHFDHSKWQQAFTDSGIEMAGYERALALDEPLPWDHIRKGCSEQSLRAERERLTRKPPAEKPSERGFKLGDVIMLKPQLAEQILAPQSAPTVSFGRKPRRKTEGVAMAVPRSRVRLAWSKGNDVRFVGHLATMRMFERAIRRAKLPVSYTQGFHPRQKLAFGPPLTLGYTSRAEYLDIQLETPFNREMIADLNCALPQGFHISRGKPVLGKSTSLSSIINLACYEVILDRSDRVTQSMIDDLLARDQLWIQRWREKEAESKEAEIRKSVIDVELRLRDAVNVLYMELAMGNLGFTKPDEIMVQCFSIPENEVLPLRVCRTELLILSDGKRLTPFEVE